LELSDLLDQNFLGYDGRGEVPSQIHSCHSTNFKDLRNLGKDDLTLRSKAKDRYCVANPNKLADLEKLRQRSLLREFEESRESRQKRLKVFRLEAVGTGCKKAWRGRDYTSIIEVAKNSRKHSPGGLEAADVVRPSGDKDRGRRMKCFVK
jgi:hypothetical protein